MRSQAFSLNSGALKNVLHPLSPWVLPLAFLLLVAITSPSSGQTPEFIYQKAGTGSAVLDPNGDGYVSASSAGFSVSDYSESEIPFKPLPVVASEPTSDVGTGPGCGFTDFVDNGSEQPSYAYLSPANNLLFRFRLGNTASNSKGYSILIDTDQKFGSTGATADPNYTVNNPGFEIEVQLATNFGVRLYDIDGLSTAGSYLVQLAAANYSQKAVALTTQCNNPDYFYDFYIPFAVITSYFPSITTATPLRMVANTVIAPQSALSGVSDIGGFDDNSAGGSATIAWTQLIANFPPTPATALGSTSSGFTTTTPVIMSPLSNGTVKVSGTSTAADGTVVRVYVNGTLYGSIPVIANAWTFTWTANVSTPALVTGQTVYATAQTGSQPVSAASNPVTVIGCSSPSVITAAASVSGGGGKDVSGTSSEPAGTGVTVYINGNTSTAQAASVLSNGTWVISPGSTILANGDVLTASTSGCGTSARFYFCKTGIALTATPTVNTPAAGAGSVTGTCVSGATVEVYKNGVYAGTALTSGTTWSFSTPVATCDYYYAYAKASSNTCYSSASASVLVSGVVAAAPVISGTYCSTGAQTVSGTSTEAAGTVIQLYKAGNTLLGTTTVSNYGYWSLSGIVLSAGDALKARAVPPVTSCRQTSAASATVPVGSTTALGALSVAASVTEGASSVGGTGAVSGSTVKLYIDGVLLGTTTASGSNWTLSGLGTYDVYAGGKLTATLTTSPNCESAASTPVTVACIAPLSTPTRTLVTASVCSGSSTTVTVGNSESEVTYQLYNGGISSGESALGTGGTITLTSAALTTHPTTLQVVASKVSAVSCQTNIGASLSVTVNSLPSVGTLSVISTPACNNGAAVLSLTATSNTSSYQLRRGSVNEGSAVTGNGSTLSFTTAAVNGTTSFQVLVTHNTTGCTASSNSVSVTPAGGSSAGQSVTVTSATVCVNSTTPINVTTENNATYTYQIRETGTNALVGSSFTGNGAIISRSPTALTSAGTRTYYVTVTTGSCSVTLTTQPTLTWTNAPSTANAGPAQTVCGSSTTLSATSPASGTGAWSQASGPNTAVFSSTSSTTPTVSNLVSGTYAFRWTVSVPCSGATSSSNDVTIAVNCPAIYAVAAAKALSSYTAGEVLATPSDGDGAITNAVLASGSSLPPGTALQASTGVITVSNPSSLVAGSYFFNITTTDAKSIAHTVSVTMSFSTYNISLPIELLRFTARASDSGVVLEWLTASERSNDYFVVERSRDALTFERLQKMKAAGTTQRVTRYQWTDPSPFPEGNYYRLRQTDHNGTSSYSESLYASGSPSARAAVCQWYPNPCQDLLTMVTWLAQAESILFQVRDLSNRVLLEKRVSASEGKNETALNISNLPDGVYLMVTQGTTLLSTQRLVKMR